MREKLIEMLESRKADMIEIRRHLHENPELLFKEEKTSQYILDFYEGKDVEVESNVGNGYGIIVTIKGGKEGKTIALRADFDALPIHEETELPFKSKNEGVMHACGHDGHTAYLLILADCFIQLKDQLPGTIKIIHQHAEEMPPGGAKSILESGKLSDVEHILGIHLLPTDPTGVIGYRSGYTMAGRAYFKLEIEGVGGHGSSPHKANDAIVAGSYFVTMVQTIISRRLNPMDAGVVTIGSFDGQGTCNVVKDKVVLEGDVRYLSDVEKEIIQEELKQMTKGLERTFKVKCKFSFEPDDPPLYNDPDMTDFIKETLSNVQDQDIKEVREYPRMSFSDDFAYYLEKIPGCYFFIGATPKGVKDPYYNHHPKFDIDEDALLVAAKAMGYVVCDYLESK